MIIVYHDILELLVKMPEVFSCRLQDNALANINLSVQILPMFFSSRGFGRTLEICPKGVLCDCSSDQTDNFNHDFQQTKKHCDQADAHPGFHHLHQFWVNCAQLPTFSDRQS